MEGDDSSCWRRGDESVWQLQAAKSSPSRQSLDVFAPLRMHACLRDDLTSVNGAPLVDPPEAIA